MFRPRNLVLLVGLAVLILAAPEGRAQTVLERVRLGHSIEEIDYIAKGPAPNHVVTLDGYEVYAIPVEGKNPIRKLFDLRGVITGHTNGLAWIESESLFAFVSGSEPTVMRLADADGIPQSPRTIRYLDGFVPEHVEGLAYIPGGSPVFPNHLILAVNSFSEEDARLEVMTTGGQVVAEIIPPPPVNEFITGVAYFAPDKILVTLISNEIWVLDFSGAIVGGPVRIPEANYFEGVVQARDGRVIAVDFFSGKAFFMDDQLARRPQDDRRHSLGVGLTLLRSLAWDADRERHLVGSFLPDFSPIAIHSVTHTLDDAAVLIYPPGCGFPRIRRSTYMADERRVAIAHQNNPRAILLYRAEGTLAEQVDVTAAGRPFSVAYIPPRRQFALRVLETNGLTLRIVSRTGEFVRDLDLSSTGIPPFGPVTYFDPDHPSGGKFLVAGGGRMSVVDFNGVLLQSFDFSERLGVLFVGDLSTITTGPNAGAFGLIDGSNSELVVFTLK